MDSNECTVFAISEKYFRFDDQIIYFDYHVTLKHESHDDWNVTTYTFNEYKNNQIQNFKKWKPVHYYDEIGKSYWIFSNGTCKVKIIYNKGVYTTCIVTIDEIIKHFKINETVDLIQITMTYDSIKDVTNYKKSAKC